MQRGSYKILFYDTEATSNEPKKSHIISIGSVMLHVVDDEITDAQTFHSFVYTKEPMDPCAESIHHIHSTDLIGHPEFKQVIAQWKQWILQNLGSCRLAFGGHNSDKFDGQILFCNFRLHNMDYNQFMRDIRVDFTFDTLTIMHQLFKQQPQKGPKCMATGRKSFKLGDCYHTFVGKPLEGAHNALTDAYALYEIFKSPKVKAMFTWRNLFATFKPVAIYHRDIEKTCGIANEFIEKHIQAEPPTIIGTDPIFDESQSDTRMCLNCMNLVSFKEHNECSLPRIRQ